MKGTKQYLLAAMAACLALTGCSRNLSSDVYTSSATAGKVVYGTILSVRQVTVKGSDRLGNNAMGGLSGGVAGGVAGSAIGGGTGRKASTVGGVIVGALLGSYIQDQLSTTEGVEYIVQLDAAPVTAAIATPEQITIDTKPSVDRDIQQSMQVAPTQTQMISVIQEDKILLAPGQRVMVVYNNDRPRVIAAH